MEWNWTVFGVGVTVASLVWAVFWAIYTRKTEAKQAIRTSRELDRSQREIDGLREVRSGALNVLQMADALLSANQTNTASLDPQLIGTKMTGRLGTLRESWAKYEGDIRDTSVRSAYADLEMEPRYRWFADRSNTSVAAAISRLANVRDDADRLRQCAEDALR